jgi:hypothetical protein
MRDGDDPRSNSTAGLPIPVTYRKGERADLALVRAAVKSAGSAFGGPATTSAQQHLQPLMMILPSPVLRMFSRTAKAAECLCTNLGDGGRVVGTIAGVRARSVIMRAVMATDDTELFRRLEGGIHLTWSTDGDTAFVAIHGMDPDRFPTREVLRDNVEQEFHEWGLTPRFWS